MSKREDRERPTNIEVRAKSTGEQKQEGSLKKFEDDDGRVALKGVEGCVTCCSNGHNVRAVVENLKRQWAVIFILLVFAIIQTYELPDHSAASGNGVSASVSRQWKTRLNQQAGF